MRWRRATAPTLQLQWPQEAMRARKRAIGSAQVPLKCDEEDPPAGRDEEQAMGYILRRKNPRAGWRRGGRPNGSLERTSFERTKGQGISSHLKDMPLGSRKYNAHQAVTPQHSSRNCIFHFLPADFMVCGVRWTRARWRTCGRTYAKRVAVRGKGFGI